VKQHVFHCSDCASNVIFLTFKVVDEIWKVLHYYTRLCLAGGGKSMIATGSYATRPRSSRTLRADGDWGDRRSLRRRASTKKRDHAAWTKSESEAVKAADAGSSITLDQQLCQSQDEQSRSRSRSKSKGVREDTLRLFVHSV